MNRNKTTLLFILSLGIIFSSSAFAKTRSCDGEMDVSVSAVSFDRSDIDGTFRREYVGSYTQHMSASGSAALANKARRRARTKLIHCWYDVGLNTSNWGESGSDLCDDDVTSWDDSINHIVFNDIIDGQPHPETLSWWNKYWEVDVHFSISGGTSDCDLEGESSLQRLDAT